MARSLPLLLAFLLAAPAWAQTYNTIPINGSNSFNTELEAFRTNTDAATGYTAYATWDADNLYFGYTGSDLGEDGDCADPEAEGCEVYETGASETKWVVYYLDTTPTDASDGTREAKTFGGQSWRLPEHFAANYLVEIRTDGSTADDGTYTGNAFLSRWTGEEWERVETGEGPAGNSPLTVWQNQGSNFLEFSLDLAEVGSPRQVRVASWFLDEETDRSYAFWPRQAVDFEGDTDASEVALSSWYGFVLGDRQGPNASGGLANLDRPFFGEFECPAPTFPGNPGGFEGQDRPFHTIPINGSNAFNAQNEEFATSTSAATGYAAYATWDDTRLYFGFEGSDIGEGDCSDPEATDCAPYETGQSPNKWLVYFIDTDPTGDTGTTEAYVPSDTLNTNQTWTLPFQANYAIYLRTDGSSSDEFDFTGVAEVKRYENGTWQSLGPCPVQPFFNNTSSFLEFAVNLSDLGNPFQVKMAAWMFDADEEIGYAYWPEDAPASFADASAGTTSGSTTIENYWGFELRDGVIPNASGNKNREFLDSVEDQVTYNTYTIDGSVGSNEQLPQEALGRQDEDRPALYLTWDADNLYLSFDGNPLVDTNSDLYLAFDTEPVLGADPREGNGRIDQPGDAATSPTYPFAANVVIRFDGTSAADGSVQDPAPGARFTVEDGEWRAEDAPEGSEIIRQEGGPTELALPWNAIGLEEGDYFHLVVYLSDGENQSITDRWPTANPEGQAPDFTHFLSYYLQEGAAPFSKAYESVRTEEGSTLAEGLYANLYLIVPNADENEATWELGENTTVVNELYIGRSATLDVGDNDRNTSGHNILRFGRQLTSQGTFEEREGDVIAFDPAEGYPEDLQPVGGFATPSFTSSLVCDPTFYDFTPYNEVESLECPDEDEGTMTANMALAASTSPTAAATRVAAAQHEGLECPSPLLTIRGTFTLFGVMDLDVNLVTTGTIANAGDDAYISASVSRIADSRQESFFFPVGDEDAYRPVEFDLLQATAEETRYTARVIGEAAPYQDQVARPLHRVSSVRYWQVCRANGAELEEATLTLTYGEDDGVTFPSTLRVAQFAEGRQGDYAWRNRGGQGTATEEGTIMTTRDITSLDTGLFTLAGVSTGSQANPLGSDTSAGEDADPAALAEASPLEFGLEANYPNPFSQATSIRYALAENADVTLKVYNVLGQEVATLVEAPQGAGRYEVMLDASGLASGTYYYRLDAGPFSETHSMVIVK